MPENSIVKTIKLMYLEDFEEKTSELITVGGYRMISAGYSMISDGYSMISGEKRGYWWAVLVKEENK